MTAPPYQRIRVKAVVCNGSVRIQRVDPADLTLETADELAAISRAVTDVVSAEMTTPSGPTRLKMYQHGFDGTPFAGIWLALEGDTVLGYMSLQLPRRDNTDSAHLSGGVHPDHQGKGVGNALHAAVLEAAGEAGRTKAYSGALAGSPGVPSMHRMGYETIHGYAVSHLDVHDAPWSRLDRLYDDALSHAGDYELVRRSGRTPDDEVDDVVALFAAINDAPMTDPGGEPDVWDAERVTAYDEAMAARRQTVYRVLARHRETGAWAGHTVVCVDEFDPTVAHQEDTSVVGPHRGHRLGLLLKLEMLRWLAEERPEVRATETWNSSANHHMLAVNETLGTRVIAHHLSMRRTVQSDGSGDAR